MLTAVTNRDSNHLVPRIDPVPVGSIDAFGRDDGWIGDRPADCGNFWLDRSNVEDPPYLSGGVMTKTPGIANGSFLGSIWLGGTSVAVEFDVTTGPDLSSTSAVFCYLLSAGRPEFAPDQILFRLRTDATTIVRTSSGSSSDVASGTAVAASTTYRIYATARPVTGGWHVKVEQSAIGGAGRTTLVSGIVTSTATPGWLSFATSGSMTGVTIDNVDRVTALAGGLFSDDFDSGIGVGWTANQGSWSVDGSGYVYSTTGNDSDTLTRDFGQADMVSRVALPAVPSGTGASIINRYIDGNNFFLFSVDHTANVIGLAQRVGGTTTGLGSHGFTYVAGDVLELVTIGSTIEGRVLRGGSVFDLISATSSALPTATRTGFRTGYTPSGSVRFNDFAVYG